jgi:hypothetical protein
VQFGEQDSYYKDRPTRGIPSEKIKWKSENGKNYDYIIREYSLDGESENYSELNIE